MKSPLRVLHLEDDEKDAELIQAALDAEGIARSVRERLSQAAKRSGRAA